MALTLLIVRLALAAVFVVSGVAKLLDPTSAREGFKEFRIARSLQNVGPFLVSFAELAVATLLVPIGTAWFGALGAVALTASFTAVVGWAVANGRNPECHCFGQLSSRPVGWTTMARNIGLLSGAALLAAQGPHAMGRSVVPQATSAATVVEGVLTAVLVALMLAEGAVWWNLSVRLRVLERRLDEIEETDLGVSADDRTAGQLAVGLAIGSPAPEFVLPGLHGEVLTLASLGASGRPVVLVFSDPACGPCQTLMPDVGRWQAERSSEFTVAVVSRGSVEDNRAKSTEHLITNVLIQADLEVAEQYAFNGTPNAVIVDAQGRIATGMAAGVPSIQRLVDDHFGPHRGEGRGEATPRDLIPVQALVPSPIGREAAPFTLRALDVASLSLADFGGQRLLIVFWNPGCGFCTQIAEEMRRLEQIGHDRGARFLFISEGPVEDNRAIGFASPVLIDQGFATGSAYGAQGTPSAISVDAAGRISSELAVGGPAVLALADGFTAEPNDLDIADAGTKTPSPRPEIAGPPRVTGDGRTHE